MILVTGGAGFIGSNFIAAWEADGRGPVVVCDRLDAPEKWRNLAKRTLYDFIQPEQLTDWLAGRAGKLSAVVHLGAISTTTASDAEAIVRNNIRLSLDLWDWCTKTQVPLLYASSASVYGDGAAGFDDNLDPSALARLRPLNLYGWSKLFVDRRIAQAVATGERTPPHWAGLRFFNVFGPNEYHKTGQLSIALAAYEQLSTSGRCRLYRSGRPDIGHGGQKRDFVWIDDCVAAMLFLLDRPKANGLFNIGSGAAHSFQDMALAVAAALDRAPSFDYVEMPPALGAQYQYFTQAPLARLRAAGFKQEMTAPLLGVKAYVDGYLSRPDRYR
jgi:ADP-L-glycero-D-manno-heptose 6-epimerase